jgi:putative addiction module component (TIGR02574 family)
MTITVSELFKDAATLSEPDRAALAGLLLESLDISPDAGVEAAWAEEIERRVKQVETGEAQTVPWEVVRARMLTSGHGG